MYKYLLLLILFTGCKKKSISFEKEKKELPEMRKEVKHIPLKRLNDASINKINNWQEFNTLTNYIKLFQKITPNNGLSNANELKTITDSLKESLITDLKNNAFKARMTVFESEVLRLQDMSTIPSIKPKEVNLQIDKIITLYNGMVVKINTIYKTNQFNEEIDLSNFFKIDSTKK